MLLFFQVFYIFREVGKNMNKKIIGIFVCTLMIAGTLSTASTMNSEENDAKNYNNGDYAPAATPADIENAINLGISWLVTQQDLIGPGINPYYGSWGKSYCPNATTAFVLIKLQDRAYELGKDPFETDMGQPDYYEYATNVIAGWEYLYDQFRIQSIFLQNHILGASGNINDNPDTNSNSFGVYIDVTQPVYSTGICLMAIVASGTPTRVVIHPTSEVHTWTYKEVAQEMVDWLAWAQGDIGPSSEGGYSYEPLNNAFKTPGGKFPDNSVSGYAYLGLAAAEAGQSAVHGATPFACIVPGWVKTELKSWIAHIQDPTIPAPTGDGGGSLYTTDPPGDIYMKCNQLRTGNLLFEMTYADYGLSDLCFKNALAYIEYHWRDENAYNAGPGWGYGNPGSYPHMGYQAMFCLMKGFQYSNIPLIDTDGDTIRDDSWYNQDPPTGSPYKEEDFASVLVRLQTNDHWTGDFHDVNPYILSTVWALLTLEKISVIPPPKWEQLPDIYQTGIDIRVDRNDGVERMIADDFLCDSTDPITDVHIWGSWKNDTRGVITKIHLSIHADIPASPSVPWSKPGALLWEKDFDRTQFTEWLYYDNVNQSEWWWDPWTGELIPNNHHQIWEYDIDIPPEEAFIQNGTEEHPVIYWLDVYVTSMNGSFGWKTSWQHWQDDAVRTPEWTELFYPIGHPYANQTIDMAFRITTTKPECCYNITFSTINTPPFYLVQVTKKWNACPEFTTSSVQIVNNGGSGILFKSLPSWSFFLTSNPWQLSGVITVPCSLITPMFFCIFGTRQITITVTIDDCPPVTKTATVNLFWVNF